VTRLPPGAAALCAALLFACPSSASAHRRSERCGRRGAGRAGCREDRANYAVAHSRPRSVAITATAETPPCPSAALPVTPAGAGAAQNAVLCLVNRLRAAHRERALTTDAALQAAARRHATEMIAGHFFAHTSPDGSTMTDRDEEAGYLTPGDAAFLLGENLAWGTGDLSSPASIVAAWERSPEHRANMLDASYRQTGIAVLAGVPDAEATAKTSATYVQEFGTVLE